MTKRRGGSGLEPVIYRKKVKYMTLLACQKNFPVWEDDFAGAPCRGPGRLSYLYGKMGRAVLPVEDALDGEHVLGVEDDRPLQIEGELLCLM